jgi:hypothetical protein
MEKKITTSDLRLGNWLYESDKSKFPMQVESIGKNWIYIDFEGNDGDSFEITVIRRYIRYRLPKN